MLNKSDKAKVILEALWNMKQIPTDEQIKNNRAMRGQFNGMMHTPLDLLNTEYDNAVKILNDRVRANK